MIAPKNIIAVATYEKIITRRPNKNFAVNRCDSAIRELKLFDVGDSVRFACANHSNASIGVILNRERRASTGEGGGVYATTTVEDIISQSTFKGVVAAASFQDIVIASPDQRNASPDTTSEASMLDVPLPTFTTDMVWPSSTVS